jgi:hypothetical protein
LEVEVSRLFVPISPARHVPDPEIFRGREQTPPQANRVRKENFNEETRSKAGISFYFRCGRTHCIVFEALP